MPICEFETATYRWVHFDATDPALPAWLEANVPDLPRRTLLQVETRPRCDSYEDGLILNLRGVNLNEGASAFDMVSLRIWVIDGLIVTVRFRKIFAVDAIRVDFEEGRGPESLGAFIVRLVDGLTDRIEQTVLHGVEAADEIEAKVFDDEVAVEIGPLRRETIGLRRYVGPQRDALQKLSSIDVGFLSKTTHLRLREAMNRTTVAVEALASTQDRLIAAQDHLDASQANRQGRNGYVLSIVAAIFLPLGFLTGVFGMNVAGLPGTEWPYAFAALCAFMVVVALVLIWVFKQRDWL
ncbi:zinc transporter [Litoreibacter ponti]|uniref:Zinc transporter n=1 Tax=Litoreibacter ponti TaxID=1510457 RepID=A0A2T6BP81_9RHOB|nr:zinc transporter ZntB [Litoreibacter ponti]PTX57797.1 zinc transporter [Litoreibacter ponti]